MIKIFLNFRRRFDTRNFGSYSKDRAGKALKNINCENNLYQVLTKGRNNSTIKHAKWLAKASPIYNMLFKFVLNLVDNQENEILEKGSDFAFSLGQLRKIKIELDS